MPGGGVLLKGAPPLYKGKPPPPPTDTPIDPTDTDFDAAILQAATHYGTKTPKVGLAGYAANLRDTRPQDFALLVTRAHSRKKAAIATAISGLTSITFTVAPSGQFLPYAQAREDWVRRHNFIDTPQLVVDNTDTDTDDFDDTPDETDEDT